MLAQSRGESGGGGEREGEGQGDSVVESLESDSGSATPDSVIIISSLPFIFVRIRDKNMYRKYFTHERYSIDVTVII